MTAIVLWGMLEVEGSSKKEKGLVDMDNSVTIGRGGNIIGLNGNGEIQLKMRQ